MPLSTSLERYPQRRRQLLEQLTARLPEWFGLPVANLAYAAQAEILPGYVAHIDGLPRGLLLLKTHSAISVEIHWMGVDPDCHRAGVGRALVAAACAAARADGAEVAFVYTLHPKVAYEPYARTRRFYEAMGFRYVLEEPAPDRDNPLALYMKGL
jgi:GNAT superfamily N-acetyltransferase